MLVCFSAALPAQTDQVWPGDIDNNGLVDGADLLRWGYSFGKRGYSRPDASTAWSGQPMGELWVDSFPDGINLAYADTDGDGRVLSRDLTALFTNRHRTRVSAQPFSDFVRPDTTDNYEARLGLASAGVSLTSTGAALLLDVMLTGKDSVLTTFHGLSFKASFRPGMFPEWDDYEVVNTGFGSSVVKTGAFWISTDSLSGTLSFTLTESDHRPHRANGALMRLTLPLADNYDLDDLADASIVIDSLLLHDPEMRHLPTVTDTLTFNTETSCNFSVAPVCGLNGVTYLNGCFAEAAGVTVYTSGPCWSPGLD
ncbi:MAG: hypothetical protein AAF597_15260, partial [Bacteroidota bacterium]